MSYLSLQKSQAARKAQSLYQDRFVRTPDFAETFALTFDETTEVESLSSEQRMLDVAQDWQKRQIKQLRDDGKIPEDVWNESVGRRNKRDWGAVAEWSNENLETSFDFSYETAAAQLLERTQARQALLSNTSMFSAQGVAAFLGTSAAMFNPARIDILPTLMLGLLGGVGSVSTASVFRASMSYAMREAGIAAVEEGLTQVATYNLRNKIGDEYRLSDAATNLLAGIIVQGSLGGAMSIPLAKRNVAQARDMAKRDRINANSADLQDALDAAIGAIEAERTGKITTLQETIPAERVEPRDTPIGRVAQEEIRADVLNLAREELEPVASAKLTRGEVKQIEQELVELRHRLDNPDRYPLLPDKDVDTRRVSKKRQKKQAERKLTARIERLEQQLADDVPAVRAQADLDRIQRGEVPKQYAPMLEEELRIVNTLYESSEVPETEIFGPLDPLRPEQRAALEDLKTQRQMLRELDFRTTTAMTAEDAQTWLDSQWLAFQQYADHIPQPDPESARIALRADQAPDVGPPPPDAPPPEVNQIDADITEFKAGNTYQRLQRNADGEVELVESDWGDLVDEEKQRLNDLFKRADELQRCAEAPG